MKTSKHNHKGTNKLKVCLLSLFLLMPFICFIPTAFYYGFNEQAQAQTKEIVESNYYNTSVGYDLQFDELLNDTIYTLEIEFDINDYSYTEFEYIGLISSSEERIYDTATPPFIEFDVDTITISDGNYHYVIYNNYLSLVFVKNDSTDWDTIFYDYLTIYGSDLVIPNGENSTTTYTMSITDSMSTAWTNTWSNPLFSWVNNNPLKNNIDGFVNWFGITDSAVIPQYLTYIVSIVGIYIVIDIILVLFTHLTHMFSKEQS